MNVDIPKKISKIRDWNKRLVEDSGNDEFVYNPVFYNG